MLANQLVPKYRYENCAVVALDDGGVLVGAQIAASLHCVLTMLQTEEINLPRELESVASIAQDGSFSYNKAYSPGEIDGLVSEFRGFIEQEKLMKLHQMNVVNGSGSTIEKHLLRNHNVILVSDGLKGGFAIDMAQIFLKPVALEKLIIATPLASVQAVDHMHIAADEVYCLSVVDNNMTMGHYYEEKNIPDHEKIIEIISQIVLNWR